MKKLLWLTTFLAITLFVSTFSYAKEYKKNFFSGVNVSISVLGSTADISITNNRTSSSDFWGYVNVWGKKINYGSGYEDNIYKSNGSITIKKGEATHIPITGLDASNSNTYYFTLTNGGGSKEELVFGTLIYSITKGEETADGGYNFLVSGDSTDTRDMFLVLNKTLYPVGGDVLGWIGNSIKIPMGKFSGSTIGSTTSVPVTVPPDKAGKYTVGLVAKDSGGSYSPIILSPDSVIFGLDKVGQIYFNEATFNTNTQTLEGSLDISKHKSTDLVPISSISIKATVYKLDTKEVVFPLNPIERGNLGSDGKYSFQIKGSTPLDGNTWYDMEIVFESDTGATASHTYKFNTRKGIVPETGKVADDFYDKNSYRLLAPIPGMVALLDPALCQLEQQRNPGQICDVNAFLNFLLSLIIGLAAVVLVVRLVIEGYSYMITDTPFKKAAAKGAFLEALTGLVIALSSYLILNTINPKLVHNDVTIGVVEFDVKQYPTLDSSTYQKITGSPILPKSQYVALAQKIATEVGIDSCLLIATATAESNMNPAVFGSDADFALDVPSRRALVNSGIKYSGTVFTKGDTNLITDKAFKNDNPKGVIDGRFSFGFGMLGVTMFPEGYCTTKKNPSCSWEKNPSYNLRDKPLVMDNFWPLNPKTNKKYTPTELLDAETSLRLGAFLLQKKSVECKDPYKTLYSYNTGGCSGDSIGGATRKKVYDQCKGIK